VRGSVLPAASVLPEVEVALESVLPGALAELASGVVAVAGAADAGAWPSFTLLLL
jgi:hypothetical protein